MRAQISASRGGEGDAFGAAADVHVAARFALGRDAVEGAGGFAVDQDDAFVALAHGGFVALDHERLARAGEMHFEQGAEVFVVGADAEDAGAAVAE